MSCCRVWHTYTTRKCSKCGPRCVLSDVAAVDHGALHPFNERAEAGERSVMSVSASSPGVIRTDYCNRGLEKESTEIVKPDFIRRMLIDEGLHE